MSLTSGGLPGPMKGRERGVALAEVKEKKNSFSKKSREGAEEARRGKKDLITHSG